MNLLRIYSAFLKDGDKEIMLQPFISTDNESAANTVKNAIREDDGILSIAMAERIILKWICDFNSDDDEVVIDNDSIHIIFDETYFRKYAQTVYADKKKKEANEAEAEVMSDPETKEAFYHDMCESTQIPSDEYMKGEFEDD